MRTDPDDAERLISDVLIGALSTDPNETLRLLSPIADFDHVQIPWVWYALSLAADELGREDEFLTYSELFCFSPKTQRLDFRTGKLSLLTKRVAALMARGIDIEREKREYLDLSPAQKDVDVLRALGVTGLEVSSSSFPADKVIEWVAPNSIDQASDPVSLVAPHFSVGEIGPPSQPRIAVAQKVDYLSIGEDYAATRSNGGLYRELCRSDVLRHGLTAGPALQLGGRAVVLSDLFSLTNYCHWMCDWYPRLLIAQHSVGPIDWVCARIAGSGFEMETLCDISGLPRERILLDGAHSRYAFDELVSVDNLAIAHTHPLWRGNPQVLALVRQAVLPVEPKARGRRIYISRSDAGTRRVTNETELAPLFARYGVETVTLSGLSVKEQALLFGSCELVIGVHGAGLTNIMFMPAGAKVLELFHYQFGSSAYVTLAKAARLKYFFLSCDDIPHSDAPVKTPATGKLTRYQYADIWLDPEHLGRALEVMTHAR